jgi:nitrate reductase cytochrome c-type subunit
MTIMAQTKKTAGYTLMACVFAAGAWIAATAIGSVDASSTETTSAATDEAPSMDARFVEPTSVDYGAHLESR